ncbi:pollen-specific leucine-rich repeat extensin-like protein 1 isoform X2 [Mizuhopecten yessoensis]|uniref:pollen-specific leucine-rich repeat extensin-like protein 1 isoform X2 n=1 Tax=Mizuhopecten yessoensis TaxID=6573 RepID=UPI000B4593D9|nr:pollen-specific leucine-rich repeat extensin-like protein 1 isoform X2 [Mizuhopecten yessoensis]
MANIRVFPCRRSSEPVVKIRVFSNTPAEGELQRGDIFLEINTRDAAGFTHKQALDQIKFGGGQIDLLIERPATPNINPLHPQSPTRAPSNLPAVLPGAIQIPIKKRPDPVYAAPSMHPPQNTSGHQPKKITLNTFGGGTTSFGASYGKPPAKTGWSPQQSPSSSQQQYSPQPNMMVRVQDSLDSALSPRSFSSYQQPVQHQAPPPMRQFSAGPSYPSPGLTSTQAELQDQQPSYIRSSDPVPEEDFSYIPVSQRKQTFSSKPAPPPQDMRYNNGNNEFQEVGEEEEDNYPTAPVWERRKMFGQAAQPQKAVPKGKKGPKPFKPQSQDYADFGVDYTKIKKQPEPARFQPSAPPAPPPVQSRPVNYSGDNMGGYDRPPAWSSSLRSSNVSKPWELEQQDSFMPVQNTPQRGGPPSVSPKPTSPRPPAQAPVQRQIPIRMSSTATPSGPTPANTKTGDRDWSESHVYRMLHDRNPASHAAPAVNTKPPPPPVAYKPVHQPPAPPAQKQYQQAPQNNYGFDDSYGTSDF